jgi:hypothetical protein
VVYVGAMKRGLLAPAALVALLFAGPARATLTASETEQIRHDVATAQNVDRVRALVARPDLSADESAAAMTTALTTVAADDKRMAFLHALVFGDASTASRPALATATVRGLLARADALYGQHGLDLERSPDALKELARVYGFVEEIASASPQSNVPDSTRDACAKALSDHFTRNGGVLKPDSAVVPPVVRSRAQAAVALFDLMPDTPTKRVDGADKLGLTGARRAALVEAGLLVLDAGGPGADGRVADARAMLDRMPGAREGGAEVAYIGDDGATFHARGNVVVAAPGVPGPLAESSSPWGIDADPPSVDGSTVAIARGVAEAAVVRAIERRPDLRVQIDRDGGQALTATAAGMLAVDAQRTVDVAAAHLLAGQPQAVALLADAIGALAAFAPAASPADGLAVPVGRPKDGHTETIRATHVSLAPTGAATSFQLDGHLWRVERDDTGAVTALHRDGVPVTSAALSTARLVATDGTKWTSAGFFVWRLAGSPLAGVAAGPRVRVVGRGADATDSVVLQGPGDDLVADADLRIDGGPAGMVVRAVVGAHGFKGASVLIVPGSPMHAVLLMADGAGVDVAATPLYDVGTSPTQHVHIVTHGTSLEAHVGKVLLTATMPADMVHGDVALRAYPMASVEATGLSVHKP